MKRSVESCLFNRNASKQFRQVFLVDERVKEDAVFTIAMVRSKFNWQDT